MAAPHRRSLCLVAATAMSSLALTGCGSSGDATISTSTPTASSSSVTTTQPVTTPTPTNTVSGPPDFIVNATTEQGDKVRLEGHFGPPMPPSQSDVDQTALAACPPPVPDGRALIVRLDLTARLESSLSGEVGIATGYARNRLVNFVMGYSEGARCENGEPGSSSVSLGSLQPGQSASFTMWVVLPDVVTPDDPQPSEQTLSKEGWFIETPQPTVNGSGSNQDQQNHITGSRVVTCQNNEATGHYVAVVGTPRMLTEHNIQDYQEIC